MSEHNKSLVRRVFEEVHVTMYLTAFPDLRFTIQDQRAEGDEVVTNLGLMRQLGVSLGLMRAKGPPVT